MSKFSIRKQIWIAFFLLLSGLVAVSSVAFYGAHNLARISNELANSTLPGVRTSIKLRADINDLRVSGLYHILFESPEEMTSEFGWWEKKVRWVEETRRTYDEFADSDNERRLLAEFDAAWAAYVTAARTVLAQSTRGEKREAFIQDRQTLTPLIDAANEASTRLVDLAQAESDVLEAETVSLEKSVNTAITAVVAVSILLAGVVIVLLTSSVGKAIASIVDPMKRLADGNLDVDIPHRGRATEVGTIADAVQVFKEGLN